MKEAFLPKTLGGKLNWLGEEASELGQAISKTERFSHEKKLGLRAALHLYDPTVPHDLRETNHAWILRELTDLKAAIALFEAIEIPCCSGTVKCGFKPHQTFTCYRCKKLRCFCYGADGHSDCIDCWSKRQKKSTTRPRAKKSRHAKKQSQQARPKRPQNSKAKEAGIDAGVAPAKLYHNSDYD